MADDACYIGLDVGGTFLKGARLDAHGHIEQRLHEPSARDARDGLLVQLAHAVATLRTPSVRGVGVGLPGIVDPRAGRVRVAPNLHVLDGVGVADDLSRRVGLPARMENDANAAALAETWLGAGRGAHDVLFVSLGTGVGGGIVLGDRLWTGHDGYAGEIGHVEAEPGGEPCGCGSRGCVETVAGAPAWGRLAARFRAEGRSTRLPEGSPDPKAVVEAARDGDAVALAVVDAVARALGIGIAAALNLLNFERLVLGGGVAAAGEWLLERIVDAVRRRAFADVVSGCEFRLAELGNDAGVIGAARVALLAHPPGEPRRG